MIRIPHSIHIQRLPSHQDVFSILQNSAELPDRAKEIGKSAIDRVGSVEKNLISKYMPYVTGEVAFQRQKELMSLNNAFSAEQAEIARRHNIYMADTAYQRAVKDMRRAGLNPYLAYSSGGAPMSSSPSPSSSSAGSPPSDRVVETLATSAEILAMLAKLVKKK